MVVLLEADFRILESQQDRERNFSFRENLTKIVRSNIDRPRVDELLQVTVNITLSLVTLCHEWVYEHNSIGHLYARSTCRGEVPSVGGVPQALG
jgi:hypothetical protein